MLCCSFRLVAATSHWIADVGVKYVSYAGASRYFYHMQKEEPPLIPSNRCRQPGLTAGGAIEGTPSCGLPDGGRCHTRELLGTFTICKKKSRRSSLPIDVGNPV